jgi:hypothetical protein
MEEVEELSEAAANRLIEFSDALRKRDYGSARKYLSQDFLGTAFPAPSAADSASETTEALALGISLEHVALDDARKDLVGGEEFIAALERLLLPLESIDVVFFKTRGAEFEHDQSRGLLTMTANIIGLAAQRRPHSFQGWAKAEVVRLESTWYLRRFVLERLQRATRATPIFTDVASPAGLEQFGPRIGTAGNSSFYWRGAAAADIDGDGLFDLFTSASDRNFLYRNRGDGSFDDVTKEAGLFEPAGVTGPLFFDLDRDGDQDLFCGCVGWKVDGVPYGQPLRLYLNDGKGRFEDRSREFGLDGVFMNAFSACAADVDRDGWLDLYVCNYNRLDAVYPNSWYNATNGSPNALFLTRAGRRFEDVAAKAGVAGTD